MATYRPQVYDVGSVKEAKSVILTNEDGLTPQQRWERETPIISGDVRRILQPSPGSVTIDYGCGIGRLAKELLARHDIFVLGVDISLKMRAMSHEYVDNAKFSAVSRRTLSCLVANGFRADHAYVVWVLQHCMNPLDDIALLHGAMKPGGTVLVVNLDTRAVPTDKGYQNDGVKIEPMLDAWFAKFDVQSLTEGATTSEAAPHTFCKLYTK